MNQSFYSFDVFNHNLQFEFVSTGKKSIHKAVVYSYTGISNVFSVALLDVFDNGAFDDRSISNNGDMEKILVTVYQTFAVFFQQYPNAFITFEGSTFSRTRLYRIAITHELSKLTGLYDVWGIINESFEMFQPNQPYTSFTFSKKVSNVA